MSSSALAHGSLEHLLPATWRSQITAWLAEDTPSFDYAGFVVGAHPRTATLWAKSPGILAGVPFFAEVFRQCGCTVTWTLAEGQSFLFPSSLSPLAIATVSGPANRLLLGERVALNILARCSGIATRTAHVVAHARRAGFVGRVAGTRKTTPGFRLVEKYAMLVGGADPHRMDLSAMVMLKDNHVWSRSMGQATRGEGEGDAQKEKEREEGEEDRGIRAAVEAARAATGFSVKIEVEVRSAEEAEAAVRAGVDVVMLDNFTGARAREVARDLKDRWRGRRTFLIEVSGGLTEENMGEYIDSDIDILSTSSIHQGVPHVDFSLKLNFDGVEEPKAKGKT